MNPFVTLVVLTVLIISGVWGSIIIAGIFKRHPPKLNTRPDDPRFDVLQEEHHQLEVRFERLEEEIGFFRELHKPETPSQLPRPDHAQE
jgi:hypothetical protein